MNKNKNEVETHINVNCVCIRLLLIAFSKLVSPYDFSLAFLCKPLASLLSLSCIKKTFLKTLPVVCRC